MVAFFLTASVIASYGMPADRRAHVHTHGPNDTCCSDYGVGAPGSIHVFVESRDEPDNDFDKEALEFATANGIAVEHSGNRLVFTLQAGKEISLFSVDATPKGLDAAKVKLAKLVEDKIKDLETNFGVAFTRDNEVVEKQWVKNDKGEWERGDEVKARTPYLNELYGIEAALYRAQPSHRAKGSATGIKFYFLLDDLTKGERPLATWRADRGGRPAIHYYPNSTHKRPVLETDAVFDPTQPLGHSYGSIEALTLHEISHNHQNVIDWWNSVESTVAGDIGFVNIGKDDDGYAVWAIQSKNKDVNGDWHLYRKDAKSGLYYRCDSKGDKIAGEKELTKSQVRKIARVQPMTYYFPSPSETYAESVMIYRLGGQYRASLLKESPELHALAKRLDQTEIDLIYGKETYDQWEQQQDQWGQIFWVQVQHERSRYIRSAEGKLVSNTAANRDAVKRWEAKKSSGK